MSTERECLVSVDVEAAGPSPSMGSLLSIGACLVDDPETDFYVELKPNAEHAWDKGAEQIHGLSRERLERTGHEPRIALEMFAAWLNVACDGRPVFVGFNAPFDWMFVADYFWRYLGSNPFGFSALDLKSYFMARDKVALWSATHRADIDAVLNLAPDHSHHALDDAKGQARLARILMGRL